jgi:uncharacterized protein (DUF58 family)
MFNKPARRFGFINSLQQFLFNKFIKNKHLKNSITLKHKTIYLLPSSLGRYFIVVAVLNFVMGINYQNNLILIMAYLMFVVMIIAVLIGYSNAKGLTVSYKQVFASFAPQSPQVQFSLHTTAVCQSVLLTYQGEQQSQQYTAVVTDSPLTLSLTLPYTQRGCYALQRIKISSNYPFGLVSVWSYIQLTTQVYVYPSLEAVHSDEQFNQLAHQQDNEGIAKQNGSEEFESLIAHLPEMGLQRISWKHFAKTQQLLVKQFIDYKAANAKFDFNLMAGDTEQRLSQLCFLVCKATEKNTPFILKLPGEHITLNTGQQHKQQCLEALSRFNSGVTE